jgi:ribosomal protein S18 acetylase RimI-like enzyme
VIVRQATPADVPALADLARRTWEDAFGHTVSAADLTAELDANRSAAHFAAALEADTVLVADHEGRLAGYVEFGEVRIAEAPARPGDQGLHRLYVDTALQRHGIGRMLMDAALAHPRLAGAPRVFLQVWERSDGAIRLYRSLGFEVVGRTTFRIGSDVAEDLVMVLDRSAPGP